MTTTTQQQSLLQAICANPHDLAVRLIYADWLEEHGKAERAEFIRVQCELADWPCECDSEERVYHPECRCAEKETLRRREAAILRHNYGLPWAMPLLDIMGWSRPAALVGSWTWRRGFIERVECHCADWLRHGKQVVRAQPVLEVKLTDPASFNGVFIQGGILQKYPDPLTWARGPHHGLGLEALPALEDRHVR